MTLRFPATRVYLVVVLLMGLRALTAGSGDVTATASAAREDREPGDAAEKLGAFSMRLAVSDLSRSRDFYERLGFRPIAGDEGQGWLILRYNEVTIGLFQGMLERNTLTFGGELSPRAMPGTSSTARRLADPDGNPVLIETD